MNTNPLIAVVPTEVVAAIWQILERHWEDEQEHYEGCSSDDRDGHIFEALTDLSSWLDTLERVNQPNGAPTITPTGSPDGTKDLANAVMKALADVVDTFIEPAHDDFAKYSPNERAGHIFESLYWLDSWLNARRRNSHCRLAWSND